MNVNLRNKILRQITLAQVDVSLLKRKIQLESIFKPRTSGQPVQGFYRALLEE
jgi:hypothetical protein